MLVSVFVPSNAVPPVERLYQLIELVPAFVPKFKSAMVGLALSALQNVCVAVGIKVTGCVLTTIAPDTALNLLQPLAVLIFA